MTPIPAPTSAPASAEVCLAEQPFDPAAALRDFTAAAAGAGG